MNWYDDTATARQNTIKLLPIQSMLQSLPLCCLNTIPVTYILYSKDTPKKSNFFHTSQNHKSQFQFLQENHTWRYGTTQPNIHPIVYSEKHSLVLSCLSFFILHNILHFYHWLLLNWLFILPRCLCFQVIPLFLHWLFFSCLLCLTFI